MQYIKPLSVALLAIGLSTPVLADNSIFIPSQHGGFKVGVNSLYLSKNDITSLSDSTYNWGFNTQIGYLFPATGNDLTLLYTRARFNDADSLNLDTIDLEGGQRITTGPLDMRFTAGLRYTTSNYEFDVNDDSGKALVAMTNEFKGIGPRFGTNVRYQLGNCFGFDTHLDTTLLVGKVKSTYQDQKYSVTNDNVNRVIPQISAKLGVDYVYTLSNMTKSALVFEVGYQSNHSFSEMRNNPFSNASDVSLNGAYLDIKYYA